MNNNTINANHYWQFNKSSTFYNKGDCFCVVCGEVLTDPESRKKGLGCRCVEKHITQEQPANWALAIENLRDISVPEFEAASAQKDARAAVYAVCGAIAVCRDRSIAAKMAKAIHSLGFTSLGKAVALRVCLIRVIPRAGHYLFCPPDFYDAWITMHTQLKIISSSARWDKRLRGWLINRHNAPELMQLVAKTFPREHYYAGEGRIDRLP